MANKSYYCAQCGTELLVHLKAINTPVIQDIVRLVFPHTCSGEVTEEAKARFNIKPAYTKKDKKPSNLDAAFDSFKFVKKLNGLPKPEPEKEIDHDLSISKNTISGTIFDSATSTDKRPKEDLRTSIAPQSIRDQIKSSPHSYPAHSDTDLESGG